MIPDVAIVYLALPLPLPITEASKNRSPAEYPEPEETTSTEVIEFAIPDTTTLAVPPLQVPPNVRSALVLRSLRF